MLRNILKAVALFILISASAVSQTLISELPTGPSINDLGQVIFPVSNLDPVQKAMGLTDYPDAIEVSGNWLPGNRGWKTTTLTSIEYIDPAGNKTYLYYGETGVKQASSQNPELSFLLTGASYGVYYPEIARYYQIPLSDYVVVTKDGSNWKPGIGSWRIK